MNIFVFGAGYSSLAFVNRIASRGNFVAGTTRDSDKLSTLSKHGITSYLFDGKHDSPDIIGSLSQTTHLLISIAPIANSHHGNVDPVLRFYDDTIRLSMPKLQWIGYLSTVGVYGNHDGAWVDEHTPTAPVSERSINRDIAERRWMALATAIKIPLTILRLSGIYGPGRNALRAIEAGRTRRLVKEGQVFNRIHVSDIAQAIDLASAACSDGIFNITDNQPAPPQDVVTFAHKLMDIEPPPVIDFATAELTDAARSFYGENKRVRNTKSKSELGMVYEYPDYQTSLQKMWSNASW